MNQLSRFLLERCKNLHPDNYEIQVELNKNGKLEGLIDSDWATDTVKHKSITGLIVMFAGGAIAYKSKYHRNVHNQSRIHHSL
jgi:hypothetical protein